MRIALENLIYSEIAISGMLFALSVIAAFEAGQVTSTAVRVAVAVGMICVFAGSVGAVVRFILAERRSLLHRAPH